MFDLIIPDAEAMESFGARLAPMLRAGDLVRLDGELGDARAFGLVWAHFDLLQDIVARTGGTTVKTIGSMDNSVANRCATKFCLISRCTL